MRLITRSLVVSALAASLILPGPPSLAGHGGGMRSERARVTAVEDGDTFSVSKPLDGGSTRVRMIGIQAMELAPDGYREGSWSGTCNGPAAARRLHQLIDGNAYGEDGKRVELSYMGDLAEGLKGRAQRFVRVDFDRDGRFEASEDVGRRLLREGMALWFPHADQYARNVSYQRAARYARSRQLGIWDPAGCRTNRPSPRAKLRMYVQWDADGPDALNVNGEWVRIKNVGSRTVNIGGWLLRESALREDHSATSPLRQYKFPSSASIRPGRWITLHVGKGRNTSSRFYWDQDEPVFENAAANGAGHGDGDGAYLFDGAGRRANLRFSFMYPCLAQRCPDRLKGNLRISRFVGDPLGADTPNGEIVKLRIPKGSRVRKVNLEGYLLESWPYSYAFGRNSVLRKGETMTIHVGRGDDSRLRKYWGFRTTIFATAGDTVRVRSYDNVVIDCRDYGNGRCSNVSDGKAL